MYYALIPVIFWDAVLDSLATGEARNLKACLFFSASLCSRATKKSCVVITGLAINALSVGEAVALRQRKRVRGFYHIFYMKIMKAIVRAFWSMSLRGA